LATLHDLQPGNSSRGPHGAFWTCPTVQLLQQETPEITLQKVQT